MQIKVEMADHKIRLVKIEIYGVVPTGRMGNPVQSNAGKRAPRPRRFRKVAQAEHCGEEER